MPDRSVVAAARRLLVEVLFSFEKLEVVVYLHRSRSDTVTTRTIAHKLSLSLETVDEALAELRRDGIVRTLEHDAGCWCLDRAGRRAELVDALVALYDEDQLEVMKLMTQAAIDRVRSEAHLFADAFLLGRKRKKGDPDA